MGSQIQHYLKAAQNELEITTSTFDILEREKTEEKKAGVAEEAEEEEVDGNGTEGKKIFNFFCAFPNPKIVLRGNPKKAKKEERKRFVQFFVLFQTLRLS